MFESPFVLPLIIDFEGYDEREVCISHILTASNCITAYNTFPLQVSNYIVNA